MGECFHIKRGFRPLKRKHNTKGKTGFLTGFTLIEILFTVGILVVCICGLLLTYINMFILSDLSRSFSLASNAVQAEIEQIRNISFDDLDDYNGFIFDLSGFSPDDSKGIIQVFGTGDEDLPDDLESDLRRVRVVACFRSRNRVIGEDSNLNGILDANEDKNGNGRLDSPLEAVTLIVR